LALLSGIIGARAGYVISHADFFAEHPLEAIHLWEGGLSWIGASAGVLAGLLAFASLTRNSFWESADVIAVPTAIMVGMCWVGCLLDGHAYGKEAGWDLDFLRSPDLFGFSTVRWPSQFIGIILCGILIFILLRVLEFRLPPGSLFLISALGIMICITLVNFTRGDPGLFIYGIRSDTYAAGLVAVFCAAALRLRRTGRGVL
jgi:phosphatidylglycerol:prolipoprotein diacylglycerol transferase